MSEGRLIIPTIAVLLLLLPKTTVAESFVTIHNTNSRLAVSETSRIAADIPGGSYHNYATGDDWLRDGSLIIGTGPDHLSWSIYNGAGGTPDAENNYGSLLPIEAIQIDSTTYPTFQYAWGKGTDRDSTVGFTVQYFTPAVADSDFVVMIYSLYAGINASAPIQNLFVGFAADWDLPSGAGSADNAGIVGYSLLQSAIGSMVSEGNHAATSGYLDGWSAGNCGYYQGGTLLSNASYVDPWNTFHSDSLWQLIQAIPDRVIVTPDPVIGNFTSFFSLIRGKTLGLSDTLRCSIVLTRSTGNLTQASISAALIRGYDWLCTHSTSNPTEFDWMVCVDCICGDTDGSGNFSIGDAVHIINYIFGGGPPPIPLCLGDTDGNCSVSIGDAVYLINYIFGGGAAPHCGF